MAFEKAVVTGSFARIGLMGPAGSGKTFGGLQILTELGCKKIACIDSERGRAKKYSGKFTFDVDDKMTDYDPRKYIEKINDAAKAGYDGLLLDSLSHVWAGTGGFLDKVDKMGGSSFSNGWKAMKPVQAQLVQAIVTYPGHVVATMRVKTEYVVEINENGKAAPKKVGTKPVQADDMEYEFDYVLMLGHNGQVNVFKQAGCPELDGLTTTREELPKIYNSIKKFLEIK
jgi:hypothetical protein